MTDRQILFDMSVDVWGEETQLLKTVEELAELQRAIVRYLIKINAQNIAHPVDDWNVHELTADILEEVNDVEIMLGQVKSNFKRYRATYESLRELKEIHLKQLLRVEGLDV